MALWPRRARWILLTMLALGAAGVLALILQRPASPAERPSGVPRPVDEQATRTPLLQGQPATPSAPGPSDASPRGPDLKPLGPPPPAEEPQPIGPRQLRVDLVHALTGSPVAGTWNLTRDSRFRRLGPPDPLEEKRAQREERRRAADAAWMQAFTPTGTSRPLDPTLPRGKYRLVLRLPEGTVAVPMEHLVEIDPGAGVTHLGAVVPVATEALLSVRLLGPDGRPAHGATLHDVCVGGGLRAGGNVTRVGDALVVRGIPHLPGEEVTAQVEWAVDADARRPSELAEDASPTLRTTIPRSLDAPWTVEVRLDGPTAAPHVADVDFDDLPWDAPPRLAREVGKGTLRVRLLDPDGLALGDAPAPTGASVEGDGWLAMPGMDAGEHDLRLVVAGHLPIRGRVRVRAGATTEATLREPIGGRLEIEVVDATGRPRPGAHVTLPQRRWFDVQGTEQRVDAWTDGRGRRTLTRVEPGDLWVLATWGERRGLVRAHIEDGVTTPLRIEVR